jgi:hypothetical protein
MSEVVSVSHLLAVNVEGDVGGAEGVGEAIAVDMPPLYSWRRRTETWDGKEEIPEIKVKFSALLRIGEAGPLAC